MLWRFIAVLVIAMIAPPAFAAVDLDQQTKDYLEGDWLIGKAPDKGPCVSANYSNYQYEFEFRKSGGRVLIFESYDRFGSFSIADAVREGDVVTLTPSAPSTTPQKRFVLKIQTADEMTARLEDVGSLASDKPDFDDILYRCGKADVTVNSSVSTEQLSVLTSPKTESIMFRKALSDLTDEQICSPTQNSDGRAKSRVWLNFEVFGPVHFYVFGLIDDNLTDEKIWHGKLDFAPIQSITSVDKTTLRLKVLQRLPGASSWSGGEYVRAFTLNVAWDGRHISIPEMNKTFVRCAIDSKRNISPAPLP